MRQAVCVLALGLWNCATASQKSADAAALREQQAHATPIRHPFEQVDGHIAEDALGGRYQLISAKPDELCFRTLIPSENGNEQLVAFYLTAVDADGATRTVHHKSLLQLGLSQQTTLNAGTRQGDSQREAVGQNQTGSAQDSSSASLGGIGTKSGASIIGTGNGSQSGGPPPISVGTAQDSRESEIGGSTDYQRVRTFAALNVCFTASPTLSTASRYMAIQRGDIGLMNPHPLRAVWALAPIASVDRTAIVKAPAPHEHADPFAPVQ